MSVWIIFGSIYIFRTRRRREIFQLKKTIRQLERKSEYHSEQVDYYHKYLKTCLANLQKNKGASSNKKQGGSRRGRSSGSDGRQVGSLTHFTFDWTFPPFIAIFDTKNRESSAIDDCRWTRGLAMWPSSTQRPNFTRKASCSPLMDFLQTSSRTYSLKLCRL